MRERAGEVVARTLHLVGREELLDDDEAVAAVRVDLFGRGLHETVIILAPW